MGCGPGNVRHCIALSLQSWLVGTGDEGPVPLAGAAEQSVRVVLSPAARELPLDGRALQALLGVFPLG